MGVVRYVAFVGLTFVIAVGIRYFDDGLLAQLGRKTGLSNRQGWAILAIATSWMFLPILFGAGQSDSDWWLFGPAIAGLGCYLLTISIGTRDEYRLFADHDFRAPREVSPTTDVVVTSGVPSVSGPDAVVSPFSGRPTVHSDWIVQRRTDVGARHGWLTVASGVVSTDFSLADAVAVTTGSHRVFSGEETILDVAEDEPLPDPVAEFVASHPDLPAPDERSETLRFMETTVPADEPVTVVGEPEQSPEPGTVEIDTAPPDSVLGTHTNHTGDPESEGEVVLVAGDAEEAERLLRRRFYWVGGFGLASILGGQLLGFWLSGATLPV